MNAQELRIGNWVSAQGRNRLCYGQIKSVNVDGCVIDFSATLTEKEWLQAGMIPIPLTEEILLKCGFVKELSSLVLSINDGSGEIYSHAPFSNLYLNYGYDADGTSPLPNSQHLHQLQNLYFALTGVELDYTP